MDSERFARNMRGFEEQKNDILKENWSEEIHDINDIFEYFELYSIFIFGMTRKLTAKQRKEFQDSFENGLIKLVKLCAKSIEIKEKKERA